MGSKVWPISEQPLANLAMPRRPSIAFKADVTDIGHRRASRGGGPPGGAQSKNLCTTMTCDALISKTGIELQQRAENKHQRRVQNSMKGID